jgi:hypothetical protein
MSEVHTQAAPQPTRPGSVFNQVCLILQTEKSQEETAEEFKLRAAKALNDYSEEEYNELPESVKMWLNNTSQVVRSNLNKKRPRSLPGLPGLDLTLSRHDITKPPPVKVPGRRRIKGEDAVTRIMTVMATLENPREATIEQVRNMVNERYQHQYSDSAIKQAANSFNIARSILQGQPQQAQPGVQAQPVQEQPQQVQAA